MDQVACRTTAPKRAARLRNVSSTMRRPLAPSPLPLRDEIMGMPELAALTSEAAAELALAAQPRHVESGALLVQQGASSQPLVLLFRGACKVTRTTAWGADDATTVVDAVRAPCLLLDVSVLDGQRATASIVTVRTSLAAEIARAAVQRIAAAHPTFAQAVMARAARVLRAQTRCIDQMVSGSVDVRLRRALDNLAEQQGASVGEGRFVAIPLRRRDLAQMVNSTTESVSRLLAMHTRQGRLQSTRDGIWWRRAPAGS